VEEARSQEPEAKKKSLFFVFFWLLVPGFSSHLPPPHLNRTSFLSGECIPLAARKGNSVSRLATTLPFPLSGDAGRAHTAAGVFFARTHEE
jgi:hypothetical protein